MRFIFTANTFCSQIHFGYSIYKGIIGTFLGVVMKKTSVDTSVASLDPHCGCSFWSIFPPVEASDLVVG